mgnify:CR=1 FL=1
MEREKAEELLNTFPELSGILVKLSEMNKDQKRKFSESLIMAFLSRTSETDGDFLAYLDRVEHMINHELSKSPNALGMLATLSRVRYKLNRLMDNQILGLKE